MLNKLKEYLVKPKLDAPGKNNIWTDKHVSKGMLEAHLNPTWDAASRNHAFMDKSVEWICSVAPPDEYKDVLDLGCGPGLYCERFYDKGYNATGVDWSERSINYAREQAESTGRKINYVLQNYLTINYENAFDIAVMICEDFNVLSKSDRKIFLENAYKALRPGGKFIFDVTTTKHLATEESKRWDYHPDGCFSSEKPHICFNLDYYYPEDETNLTQTIIITDDENDCDCFHIWNHRFTEEKLIAELNAAGFVSNKLYGDAAGKIYAKDGGTIAVAATK